MTDVKYTRTLTLEGALKLLNAAIAEATRMGSRSPHSAYRNRSRSAENGNISNAERELTRQLSVEFECNICG